MRDGEVELVLGSAGSNRIRSALLQTIVGVVDHRLSRRARRSMRRACTSRTASCTPSPGSTSRELRGRTSTEVVRFGALNLFFGGVQAVQSACGRTAISGAGDPRRGGVAVRA
jgi:gamma-glutamyltranspeptidase/glutathione hydrolase